MDELLGALKLLRETCDDMQTPGADLKKKLADLEKLKL